MHDGEELASFFAPAMHASSTLNSASQPSDTARPSDAQLTVVVGMQAFVASASLGHFAAAAPQTLKQSSSVCDRQVGFMYAAHAFAQP
jgi:hypothetical protein